MHAARSASWTVFVHHYHFHRVGRRRDPDDAHSFQTARSRGSRRTGAARPVPAEPSRPGPSPYDSPSLDSIPRGTHSLSLGHRRIRWPFSLVLTRYHLHPIRASTPSAPQTQEVRVFVGEGQRGCARQVRVHNKTATIRTSSSRIDSS